MSDEVDTETCGADEEAKLLSVLQRKAVANDYYRLLGVECKANADELAKARRNRSRELHPDHYVNNYEEREKCVRS